jgi:surface antigen
MKKFYFLLALLLFIANVSYTQWPPADLTNPAYTTGPFAESSLKLVGQCTWFVYGRIQETGLIPKAVLEQATNRNGGRGIFLGNANTWHLDAQSAGLATGTIPYPGAIAIWYTNNQNHNAFVEKTSPLMVTESNSYPTVGYNVVVAIDSTELRQSYSQSSSVLWKMPRFTVMRVDSGPISNENYQWYKLSGNGREGWSAWLEADASGPAKQNSFWWNFTRIHLSATTPLLKSSPDVYIYPHPQPISPTDGATDVPLTVTFQWKAVGGATYRLEVSRNSSFTDLVVDVSLSSNTYTAQLSPNTKYWWRVHIGSNKSSGWPGWSFTTTTTLTPTLSVNPTSLNFGNVPVGTSSNPQSYTITGSNLTSNVVINAPSGFEISTSSGGPYGSSLTLTPSSGSIGTTIYVRFSPISVRSYSGDITNTSSGITKYVSVSGAGIQPTPKIVQLYFSVNMSVYKMIGYFKPDSGDVVLVRGSFNGWGEQNQLQPSTLEPGVWEGFVPITAAPGDFIEYKYYIKTGNNNQARVPNGGWEPGSNYKYTFTDADTQEVRRRYFAGSGPEGFVQKDDGVEVWFYCDMRGATDKNGDPITRVDSLFIAGSQPPLFWIWDEPTRDRFSLKLHDDGRYPDKTAGDMIYSIAITFPKWSLKGPIQFMFAVNGIVPNEAEFMEDHLLFLDDLPNQPGKKAINELEVVKFGRQRGLGQLKDTVRIVNQFVVPIVSAQKIFDNGGTSTTPGTVNYPVLKVRFTTDNQSAKISGLKLKKFLNIPGKILASDNEVSLKAWIDINGNNQVDGTDTYLGSGTFNNNFATISFSEQTITTTGLDILLTIDVSSSADPTHWIALMIESPDYVYITSSAEKSWDNYPIQNIASTSPPVIFLSKLWRDGEHWKLSTYDAHTTSGRYYAVDFYYTNSNRPDLFGNFESGLQGGVVLAPHSGRLFLYLYDATALSIKLGIPGNFQRIDADRVIQGLDPVPKNSFVFNDGMNDRKIDMELVIDASNYRTLYVHLQINDRFFTDRVLDSIRSAIAKFKGQKNLQRVAIYVGQVGAGTELGTTNMWGVALAHHLHFQVFKGSGFSESSPSLGNVVDLRNTQLAGQIIFDTSLEAEVKSDSYQFPAMPRRTFPPLSYVVTNTRWAGTDSVNLRDSPAGSIIKRIPYGITGQVLEGPKVAKIYNGNTWHVWWKVQFQGYPVGWIAAEFIDQISPSSNWTSYNTSNSKLPDNVVWSIATDKQKNKWIGTYGGGLVKFDGVNWTVYDTSNSDLPDNTVSTIAIDKEGNKWVGTFGGLAKFDGVNWIVYTAPYSKFSSNRVTAAPLDKHKGLVKFDVTNFSNYKISNSSLPSNYILTIAIDDQGNKWIGTLGGGLAKFDGVSWTVYNTLNSGLPDNIIWTIAFDKYGNKWIGTFEGLVKFDSVNWSVYKTSNSGLPSNDVRAIAIDDSGIIWIGTKGGGLVKFDGANWTVFDTSNSNLPSNDILTISIDKQGNKWIGTLGGLAMFDGTNWNVYNNSTSELSSNAVLAISIDEYGNKWIGTSGGLAVYRESGVIIAPGQETLTQWSIKISSRVDSLSDINNFAAVHSLASDSLDPYDIPKPPAPNSNYVYLYFPHPEWGGPGPYYSKDTRRVRDLTNETIEWLFNVKTDQTGKNVLLEFNPDSLFPSNYTIVLYDLDAGTRKVLSQSDNTYTYNSGSGGERHFKLVVGGLFKTRNFQAGWNLVGIPLSIDSTLSSMFSDDVSTFYIYTYTFREGYKIDTTFTLGKGFWLGLLDSAVVDFSGIPVKDTISTNLDKYWNIISTPYLTPITKGNIFVERSGVKLPFDSAVSSGWISSALFGYDPRTKSYYLSDTLEPWLGYWFATLRDSLKLIYTPSSTAPSPKVIFADVKSDDRNWEVILSARLGEVLDKLAFFGVRDGASDGIDRFDYPKPPLPPGEKAIQVYFYHPEWNFELGPYFASDIRASFGDVKSWKFYVRCLSGGEVRLSWDLSQVPGRFNFTLFDVSSGRVVDMRSVSEYVYNAVNDETREFRIDAVTGVSEENTIPKSYALYQNYPNPFNPTTTIEFDIPERSNVKLVVYDILGREVETLIDKELEPGKYKLNFTATDLPSGVYFYTLRTPKFTKTNKMLLIK